MVFTKIAEDVETKFETSNFEIDIPLPKGKKLIGVMKDKLGRQITKQFIRSRAKTCSYIKDNNDEGKKAKGTKKLFHEKRT